MRSPKARTAPAARRSMPAGLLIATALGFLAGMAFMAVVVTLRPTDSAIGTTGEPVAVQVKPSLIETPPAVTPPSSARSVSDAVPAISADPIEDLRQRHLTLPVQGIEEDDLRNTFAEPRGGARRHEAIDVLAPRTTPVLAVEDGTVARLFLSKAGGITIYQFDPAKEYVYYYAHLERYAPGLEEGARVTRGEVIGYVGTTGNAPRDTPHLHFAIFKMTDEKKWWQGTPIDPYFVLR